MAMTFKKGELVSLKQPVISGPVVSVAIIDGELQYLVEYESADGEMHTRFFREDELESVPE